MSEMSVEGSDDFPISTSTEGPLDPSIPVPYRAAGFNDDEAGQQGAEPLPPAPNVDSDPLEERDDPIVWSAEDEKREDSHDGEGVAEARIVAGATQAVKERSRDPDEVDGEVAVTGTGAQQATRAAEPAAQPQEPARWPAVREGGEVEIDIGRMLQPEERDGLQRAAEALNNAGSTADREAGFAVVRGLSVAREHIDAANDQQHDNDSPPESDSASKQLATREPVRPARFSLAELSAFVSEEVDKAQPMQSRPTATFPDDLRPGAGVELGIKEAHGFAGAVSRHSREVVERRRRGRPPLIEPTEAQQSAAYDKAIRDLYYAKKNDGGGPINATTNPVAAGWNAVVQLRRRARQRYRDWERYTHPELPVTIRPDDPDIWELRHVMGVTGGTLPGATEVDQLAAVDAFKQTRFMEQYSWDWWYDPPKNGLRLPQTPPPQELTENQRNSMYDVLVRSNHSPHAAQAAIDTRQQEIADAQYLWDRELLQLQEHERADRLPVIPRPHPYTAAQLRAEQDEIYIKLGDMEAAKAEVQVLIADREQAIFSWDRDHANLQGLDVVTDLYASSLNDEMFKAMTINQRERVLDGLANDLLANRVRPGGPQQTEQMRILAELYETFQRIHVAVDMDPTGQARREATVARSQSGKIVKGYDPSPDVRTAVVFGGSTLDMTSVLCATIGGCRQVFTVAQHNTPLVNGRLSDELDVNFQAAAPYLDTGITANMVVIAPGAGHVRMRDLPPIRPNGAVIVTGHDYDRGLLVELLQSMQVERRTPDGIVFRRVLELPDGAVRLTGSGEPLPHLLPTGRPAAIFTV